MESRLGPVFRLGLIVLSGLAIASGQGCMTIFARGVPQPLDAAAMIRYSVTAWSLYAFALLYGAGMCAMLLLLRKFPLAQVSVSIVGVTIIASVLLTFALGQTLGWMQMLGILVVFAGIGLLR